VSGLRDLEHPKPEVHQLSKSRRTQHRAENGRRDRTHPPGSYEAWADTRSGTALFIGEYLCGPTGGNQAELFEQTRRLDDCWIREVDMPGCKVLQQKKHFGLTSHS